jgi:hypothetical protein
MATEIYITTIWVRIRSSLDFRTQISGFDSHTSFKITSLNILIITPHIYQLNAHIYLYNNIFTTLLLHVSICYTLSLGRDNRIST